MNGQLFIFLKLSQGPIIVLGYFLYQLLVKGKSIKELKVDVKYAGIVVIAWLFICGLLLYP